MSLTTICRIKLTILDRIKCLSLKYLRLPSLNQMWSSLPSFAGILVNLRIHECQDFIYFFNQFQVRYFKPLVNHPQTDHKIILPLPSSQYNILELFILKSKDLCHLKILWSQFILIFWFLFQVDYLCKIRQANITC